MLIPLLHQSDDNEILNVGWKAPVWCLDTCVICYTNFLPTYTLIFEPLILTSVILLYLC